MIQILLSGAGGKMGQVISRSVSERDDCRIAAGIDRQSAAVDYPIFEKPSDCDVCCDVIIDFSHPSLLEPLLDYAVSRKIPAVVCTTGLSPEQVDKLKEAADKIPVFFSANMSLGVSLLCELAKKAAKVLGSDFDIVFDAGQLAEFAFDDDAVSVCVFNDFFREGDIVFERMFRAVNHDGSETAVDAVFAGFKVSAVVEVKGDGEIMIFQSCFYEMFQIRRFSVFAGTGRSLKDDRRVQFSSGLGNALDDFHVVDVECTDSIVAFIGFFKHFCSSD